jgi:Tfp pilus assembly PilM family ATPase
MVLGGKKSGKLHVLGIDIGSRYVKIALQTRKADGTVVVEKLLSCRAGVDNIDTARNIKELLVSNKITCKDAYLSVSATPTDTRVITIEALPKNDLDNTIELLAKGKGNIADFDKKVVTYSLVSKDDANGTIDILIYAVDAKKINDAGDIALLAGLRILGVDLSVLSVLRASKKSPDTGGYCSMLVDIGDKTASILIHKSGVPLFTISASGKAGNYYSRVVMNKARINEEDAYREKENPATDTARLAIKMGNEQMAAWIKSMSNMFFSSYEDAKGLSRITLSGSGALPQGLREEIYRRFGATPSFVELNSFTQVPQDVTPFRFMGAIGAAYTGGENE